MLAESLCERSCSQFEGVHLSSVDNAGEESWDGAVSRQLFYHKQQPTGIRFPTPEQSLPYGKERSPGYEYKVDMSEAKFV